MGYDGGMTSANPEVRQMVSEFYRARGEDFDADYALEHGILYNMRGWCFADMTKAICARALRVEQDEDGEYSVVALAEVTRFTDAYKRFSGTEAGARILACDELDCDWTVGNADIDGGDGTVYVSPEKMIEAKRAVDDPEVWEVFDGLLEERFRLVQVGEMAPIADLLREAGVEEVGWFESY